MPSCYAQDVPSLAMLGLNVVASPEGGVAPVTRREPAGDCDPGWCRIADRDGGPRCPPGLCGHHGPMKPKPKCAHELWGRPPLQGVRAASAAEKKSAALWKARAASARELLASLDRLGKALRKAKGAKVLAPGEDELLRVVEAWKKAIAAERKPRRK